MRKGSTSLGSLGRIRPRVLALILPLCAVTAGAIVLPAAVRAQAPASADEEQAQRDALERRASWLEGGSASMADRSGVSRKRRSPLKVIHTRATWYGPGFHGRRTASGERFNRNAMTLASRHLPMGTRVRVVNPATGRAAVARVNDRGPFGHRGYTADLSQGLARRIGLQSSGRVRLEILAKDDRGN